MRVVLMALALLLAPASAHGAALVPLASAGAWAGTPIHVTAPPGDPRVFVVLRGGTVRIVRDGVLQPTPFLTVPGVDTSGERGLLSIAFAPDHVTSGLVYAFAVISGQIRILEYRTGANPDVADPSSARLVLAQDVVATNHIGGQLAFGPDGMLYVTFGENAVPANSQSLTNLLGKVLRIDPRGGTPYAIPADNPFVGTLGARGEIWALGLRNPYRAAFAPDGRLVIGDVGQGAFEEVNVGAAGANFGWPTCEGPCSPANPAMTDPFHTYGNPPSGCAAVIAGHVVRDPDLTSLTGRLLFGDLCTQPLRTLDLSPAGPDPRIESLTTGGGNDLIGFGEDAAGCVYVLADGTAYRVGTDTLAGGACPHAPAAPSSPPPRPGPGAGTPPTAPSGAGAAVPGPVADEAPASRLTVVSRSLRMDTRGRVRVLVRCTGTQRCSGRLRVRSAARLRLAGARRARTVSFGAVRLTRVPAGRRTTVRLVVSPSHRRLVTRLRRVRVFATATTDVPRGTASRTLTLRGPG